MRDQNGFADAFERLRLARGATLFVDAAEGEVAQSTDGVAARAVSVGAPQEVATAGTLRFLHFCAHARIELIRSFFQLVIIAILIFIIKKFFSFFIVYVV